MNLKHGQNRKGQTTSEYRIWHGIKQRCYNPKCKAYKNYGGRGITVCKRWLHSFKNFFEDMGKRPAGLTLERKNNDGGYYPENCCYATYKEQRHNRRECIKYKTRKNQYWFYGHGPNGEMIIENNQSHVARVFGLFRENIGKCLNNKRKTCKGWTFQRISSD